jgi:hypothetical protein
MVLNHELYFDQDEGVRNALLVDMLLMSLCDVVHCCFCSHQGVVGSSDLFAFQFLKEILKIIFQSVCGWSH